MGVNALELTNVDVDVRSFKGSKISAILGSAVRVGLSVARELLWRANGGRDENA